MTFGNDVIGEAIECALPVAGGWGLSRIADLSLAQTAFQLANMQRIWLPGMESAESVGIPMTSVATIGVIGPIDRDVDGTTPTGGLRGPFTIEDVEPGGAPTYPVLWAHDAQRERSMAFEGDTQGRPRRGSTAEEQSAIDAKVASVWATASHCHCNRDFRFNSQSTGMQFTPRRTIGGRAWLSIRLSSRDKEMALVLWANTSMGLLLHWWHSTKQQPGRGSISKTLLQSLPILDVGVLGADQLDAAVQLFAALRGAELLPMHQMDEDPVREELDTEFCRSVLRLPESIIGPGGQLDLLRRKLAREPSVRGNLRVA